MKTLCRKWRRCPGRTLWAVWLLSILASAGAIRAELPLAGKVAAGRLTSWSFGEEAGVLLVQATGQDPGRIDQAPKAVEGDARQVRVTAKLLALLEPLAMASWDKCLPTNRPVGSPRTALLDSAEAGKLLAQWQSLAGVRDLDEVTATTVSGRQMEIRLHNGELPDLLESYTNFPSRGYEAGSSAPQNISYSRFLEIMPYVSPDGHSVQLALIASVTDFLGFDDPGKFVPQAQSVSRGAGGAAILTAGPLPLPHFRVRQYSTASARVRDGETVVVGCFPSEWSKEHPLKLPALSDVPLIGRFFGEDPDPTHRKALIIFVTPRIMGGAGSQLNRNADTPEKKSPN